MTIVEKFKAQIKNAKKVVVVTHVIPDADGIGSQITLCLALRKLGVQALAVNDDPLLERFHYLDPERLVLGANEYTDQHSNYDPDLIIVVDTNVYQRVGDKTRALFPEKIRKLFIDHHPCLNVDDENQCVDTKAAATGEIIGELVLALGLEFDHKMALPIYTSIIIDTSSFRYPNVTGKTHKLVGDLIDTGISPPKAYNGIYGTKSIKHMHFLGTILSAAQTNKAGDVAWIYLNKKMIQRYSSDVEDTHAFINHLLILDNIKVVCMFRDDGDSIKVSLRSTGKYDVGEIAVRLGGGGHNHSAATVLEKSELRTPQELIDNTISVIEDLVSHQSPSDS